jgi:hypothetical protein
MTGMLSWQLTSLNDGEQPQKGLSYSVDQSFTAPIWVHPAQKNSRINF